MDTPGDAMDEWLMSAQFFGPFVFCLLIALVLGLCFRWVRHIGRSL